MRDDAYSRLFEDIHSRLERIEHKQDILLEYKAKQEGQITVIAIVVSLVISVIGHFVSKLFK